jgi:hypothetical protein
MMAEPSVWLNSVLLCDVVHEFPVSNRGRLQIGPGMLACRVGYGAVRVWSGPGTTPDGAQGFEELTWIEGHVEIADTEGLVFRCSRLVDANLFLMACVHADFQSCDQHDRYGAGRLHPIATGLQSVVDRRDEWIVLGSRDTSGLRAFSYRLRHSSATFDLFAQMTPDGPAQLAIRLYPGDSVGIDRGETPEGFYVTELAAVMVMWPHLVGDLSRHYSWGLPEVIATGKTAHPQPAVRFVPAKETTPNAP